MLILVFESDESQVFYDMLKLPVTNNNIACNNDKLMPSRNPFSLK